MMEQDDYELFRRAVVGRDADAWATISGRYRQLLISWVMRCPGTDNLGERYEDLADEALARAWKALSPEQFAGFPNLAALMAYLRRCVATTVIDITRMHAANKCISLHIDSDAHVLPEQEVIERLGRAELWQLIMKLTATEAERVAIRERFVYNLPPRIILNRHPTLFPDITAIYSAIRNLRDRLRRDRKLAQLYAEHCAA
jgi:DNA-directed RNA polymerase specialized sigma24 family protein